MAESKRRGNSGAARAGGMGGLCGPWQARRGEATYVGADPDFGALHEAVLEKDGRPLLRLRIVALEGACIRGRVTVGTVAAATQGLGRGGGRGERSAAVRTTLDVMRWSAR